MASAFAQLRLSPSHVLPRAGSNEPWGTIGQGRVKAEADSVELVEGGWQVTGV